MHINGFSLIFNLLYILLLLSYNSSYTFRFHNFVQSYFTVEQLLISCCIMHTTDTLSIRKHQAIYRNSANRYLGKIYYKEKNLHSDRKVSKLFPNIDNQWRYLNETVSRDSDQINLIHFRSNRKLPDSSAIFQNNLWHIFYDKWRSAYIMPFYICGGKPYVLSGSTKMTLEYLCN